MKTNYKKAIKSFFEGVLIGAVNGALGAGGGMLAVPFLKKHGLEQKQAHKNAVAVILPITALSAVLYLIKGYVKLSETWSFIPLGLVGAALGTVIISKISPKWLKRIFGAFMVYAGIRMVLK